MFLYKTNLAGFGLYAPLLGLYRTRWLWQVTESWPQGGAYVS